MVIFSCSLASARDYICYIIEDAYAYQQQPDNTFNRTWHEVWDAPGYKRMAFFKFDFPRIGKDEEIESITFTIQNYVSGDHDDVDEHFIYYCKNNNWSEETLTWNNAPINDIGNEEVGSHEMGIKGWVTFNITKLKEEVKPGSTVSLVMIQDNNSYSLPWTAWYSKEVDWAIPYITIKTKSGNETVVESSGGKIKGKIIEQ